MKQIKKLLNGFFVLPLILLLLAGCALTGCTNDPDDPTEENAESELLLTGEFFTAEEMDEIKKQALSWQSAQTGIGGFADIIAVEPSDESEQQVFISVDNKIKYEKLQIQAPDGAQARIISASSGAGSGEIMIGYKFTGEDSEWIEIFYYDTNISIEDRSAKLVKATEFHEDTIKELNELPPDERQFK